MDDIAFVAMSEYLDTRLWTGDKELIKGLTAKGFERCISTKELLDWRKQLEEEE
jgi:predicted nucleic acid-binding protein